MMNRSGFDFHGLPMAANNFGVAMDRATTASGGDSQITLDEVQLLQHARAYDQLAHDPRSEAGADALELALRLSQSR